jgi:2-polyprenyl-6-methoxyphenol hydroxylase-like FAD-dependent oxidoreductase
VRVVVVGAGVAGVAVAHGLRRVGAEVSILERSPQPRQTGYQLNVQTNGMYALGQLGLRDRLLDQGGSKITQARIIDARTGWLVRKIPIGDDRLPGRSFYRSDVHAALLAGLSGEQPWYGREVTSVATDADVAEVATADGERILADLVVVADGAHSTLRQRLFPQHPTWAHRVTVVLFGATYDPEGSSPAERALAHQEADESFDQINSPDTAVVVSHAGRGRLGIIIGPFDPQRARAVRTSDDVVAMAREAIADYKDPRPAYALDRAEFAPGSPLIWEIGDIDPLPSLRVGRVILVGDAGHALLPVIGQGANQAFEDAMVLMRELASRFSGTAFRPVDIDAALTAWAADRGPRTAGYQRDARQQATAVFPTGSRLVHLRNMALLRIVPLRLIEGQNLRDLAYAIADPMSPIGQ